MKTLKKILIWFYAPFRRDKGGDLKIFLFCFIAAVIFWFFNSMNREHNANISYPIRFIYNDSSLVVVSPLPGKVQMHVQGYGWNLLRKTFWFNIEPLNYKIENPLETKLILARNLLPVISEQLKGIKINYLRKDTIWVNFERKVIKDQILYVDTSKVSLAEGLGITSPIEIDPPKVLIEGPESIVNKIGDTLFLTISESKIDDNFDSEIKIFEISNLIRMDVKKARVKFAVGLKPLDPIPLDSSSLPGAKKNQKK